MALLELFAYLGDDLAYYQDDVATEAYLQTCRRRISLRRHARLVGYRVHEGSHARAWVSFDVANAVAVPLAPIRLRADAVTFTPIAAGPDPSQCEAVVDLHPSHNAIHLWTFGEHDAVLVAGATSMGLVDGPRARRGDRPKRALRLRAGDVLVLEATADPSGLGPPELEARHAVRLTSVHRRFDPLYQQAYLEVRWSFEEALPFDLTVSVTSAAGVRVCARAVGNIVLVGHGEPTSRTVNVNDPTLPGADLTFAAPFPGDEEVARHQARRLRRLPELARHELEEWQHAASHGWPMSETELGRLGDLLDAQTRSFPTGDTVEVAWRQADRLGELLIDFDRLLEQRIRRAERTGPPVRVVRALPAPFRDEVANDWGADLAAGLDPSDPAGWGPARAAMTTSPAAAEPVVVLHPQPLPDGDPTAADWTPVADLLDSAEGAAEFVVEMDDHRQAQLRFAPAAFDPTTGTFTAAYWLGNGPRATWPPRPSTRWPSCPVTAPAPGWTRSDRCGTPWPRPAASARKTLPPRNERSPEASGRTSREPCRPPSTHSRPSGGPASRPRPRRPRRVRPTGWCRSASQPVGRLDPPAWFLHEIEHRLRMVRRIGDNIAVGPPRYAALEISLRIEPDDGAEAAEVAGLVRLLLSAGQLRLGPAGAVSSQPALLRPDAVRQCNRRPRAGLARSARRRPHRLGIARRRAGPSRRPRTAERGRAADATPGQRPRTSRARPGVHHDRFVMSPQPTPPVPWGGTRAQTVRRLLERLLDNPAEPFPLRRRDLGDPTVALIDAWATMADVVAFYDERIRLEGYLDTAQQPESVLALAALTGTTPRSALAASVHLAYTLYPDDDDTASVLVAGLLAQSTPGAGEQAQTFETTRDLVARPSWNTLDLLGSRPVVELDDDLAADATVTTALDVATPTLVLRGNDVLLWECPGKPNRALQIRTVTADPSARTTRLEVGNLNAPKAGAPQGADAQHAVAPDGSAEAPPADVARTDDQAIKAHSLLGVLTELQATLPVSPARTVATHLQPTAIFSPTSDVTPSMMTALHPELGATLYSAVATSSTTDAAASTLKVMQTSAAPFGAQVPAQPVFGSTGRQIEVRGTGHRAERRR